MEPLSYVMTASEVDEYLGFSTGAIRAAISRGQFDEQIKSGMLRRSGRTWLIDRRAIEEVYPNKEVRFMFLNEWLDDPENKYCVVDNTVNVSIQDREGVENSIKNTKKWPSFRVTATIKDDDIVKKYFDFVGWDHTEHLNRAAIDNDREFIKNYHILRYKLFKHNGLDRIAEETRQHILKYWDVDVANL